MLKVSFVKLSLDLIDDKPTLVPVKAWCHQATNLYLVQCLDSSFPPFGVKGVLLAANNEFVFNIYGVIFQKAEAFTSHGSASHLQQRFNSKGVHTFSATSDIQLSASNIKPRIVALLKPELCWCSILKDIERQIGYCYRRRIIPWENTETY